MTRIHTRTLLAAACSAVLLLGTGSALAHGGGGDHWKHRGNGWGHHKHGWDHDRHGWRDGRSVVRERIIVRERPVYIEPPRHYERPYAYYPPRRDPAIVIGVDLPPLVIPLR